MYRAIPPVKEWPKIIYRAMINFAESLKDFVLSLAKIIKEAPKATYQASKYLLKRTWEGIRAIPQLVKLGAETLWSWLKTVAFWFRDLFFK